MEIILVSWRDCDGGEQTTCIKQSLPERYVCVGCQLNSDQASVWLDAMTTPLMMMIAFFTIKSSLVPLIEGLCAQIYFRFEISVVCSHLLLFFFVKEKTC